MALVSVSAGFKVSALRMVSHRNSGPLGVVAAGRVSVEWVEERRRERCSALLDRFSTLRDNGGVMGVDQVVKRDGTTVHFDRRRIENAIYAASRDVGNGEGRQLFLHNYVTH